MLIWLKTVVSLRRERLGELGLLVGHLRSALVLCCVLELLESGLLTTKVWLG